MAILADKPETQRAIITDMDCDPDNVIITIAIRNQYSFEMMIPKAKYDPFTLLELINKGALQWDTYYLIDYKEERVLLAWCSPGQLKAQLFSRNRKSIHNKILWVDMNKTELARALGISRQMVHKLIKQGMPVDSVELAQQWRKMNLNPYRTKQYRVGLMQARIRVNLERQNTS